MATNKPRFQFGNVVVVDGDQIGVIVKTWAGGIRDDKHNYDVYVRNYNGIRNFSESDIDHFIYSKELHESEVRFYL
jgi:hypothetical protein